MFRSSPGITVLAAGILVAGITSAAFPVRAEEDPLTLAAAIQRASDQAPLLEARRAQLISAQEEAHRAGALPDPVLTVGIDNLPVTGPDALDTAADVMTMKKIGLQQSFPARARRNAERTLALRTVDAAEARAEADAVAVRRAAADAWIDAWSSEQALAALQRSREQATLASAVARARVRGGSASAVDAMAAAAAELDVDNRIADQQAVHDGALSSVERWAGPAGRIAQDAPDFGRLPYTEAQLLERSDRLPALSPASAEVETAAAQVDLARAARRPDWSVAASYGQRSGGRDDMVVFEVGIGLPLFPRNRQDRGVAAREADYQAAVATREDLRREQVAQLHGAFARWRGAQRQVALDEQQLLPLVRDRSAMALAAFRSGGDLQPWLDARRDELTAELSHAEHQRALGHAWAALALLLPTEARP